RCGWRCSSTSDSDACVAAGELPALLRLRRGSVGARALPDRFRSEGSVRRHRLRAGRRRLRLQRLRVLEHAGVYGLAMVRPPARQCRHGDHCNLDGAFRYKLNWGAWTVSNYFSWPLFWHTGLWGPFFIGIVYQAINVVGYVEWRHSERRGRGAVAVVGPSPAAGGLRHERAEDAPVVT